MSENIDNILSMGDNPYDEGTHLFDNFDTRNTTYKEQSIKLLESFNFHKQTIDALSPYILNYMSSNAFMSNLSASKGKLSSLFGSSVGDSFNPLSYANLSHSESALKLFAAIHPCDKNKSVLYVLMDNIFKHTEIFTFSRTTGPDRVGLKNGVAQSRSVQEIKQEESTKETEDIKKKGVF